MKKQKSVLLGMSGGVDSSVAALLLKKRGYNVIGAFMKNFSDKNASNNQCNWKEELKSAKKIASLLNVKLIILDSEKQYKTQVLNPMFRAYKKGLTPNPDIFCNTIIKFPLLWKEAKKLKADCIATGHYARIKKTLKGFQLLQGKDKSKDQSYFLSELSQSDLQHIIFPIGNLTKSEVRKIAEKNKFPNYDKKGTAGICFIGKINMKSFLERRIKNKEGKVLDPEGNIIGKHPGSMYFTIGQRIGSRLGFEIKKHLKGKWYIAEKRRNNIIIIAPKNSPLLKKQKLKIKKIHLINPKEKIPSNLKARIRHLGKLHKGKLSKKNHYYFTFFKPVEQIAPGQSIVIYNRINLIGKGEIAA